MNDVDVDVDELGPVDYLVVEFPGDKANFSGEMRAELSALVDSGTVRVLDLLFVVKEPDGSIEGFESHEFDAGELGELRTLEGDLAMLLAAEDVEAIGAALEPRSVAAVLVWENVWAAPFGSAIRRSGGQLVAGGRVPSRQSPRRSRPMRQLNAKECEKCWVEVELVGQECLAGAGPRRPRWQVRRRLRREVCAGVGIGVRTAATTAKNAVPSADRSGATATGATTTCCVRRLAEPVRR